MVAFFYALWIEPKFIDVTITTIPVPQLPLGSPAIRIVHVSDFHSPSNLWVQSRLPGIVRRHRPDAIVFTGDAVNTGQGVRPARATFAQLGRIAPTFVVRGNRDLGAFKHTDLFRTAGVTELRGTSVELLVRGFSVTFIGASFTEDWLRVRGSIRKHLASDFIIFVGHSPDDVVDVARWGADLYLAGHTHGGQVALPVYGAVWTASRFGKRFEAGLYREQDTWLYINRGIGMESLLPKVRFLARPEVSIIELRAASPSL
jgi:uncharacterized protein